MIDQPSTDIIPFLKTLASDLQALAEQKNIRFEIYTTENEIKLDHAEDDLRTGLKKLISSIIDYMPENNTVYLHAEMVEKGSIKYVSIKIRNTGINLKVVAGITKTSTLPVTLFSFALNETTFEVCYPLLNDTSVEAGNRINDSGPFNYINFVRGIKSHFSKLKNPVDRLAETRPKEAAFLASINYCILKNMEDESFDANALSIAISMSRAQLFRRLKSLTGNSAAYYIRTIRLEKAKELLETTDMAVSEVAYKTGFNTPSNFTKVFSEKYGITPSQLRHPKRDATNE